MTKHMRWYWPVGILAIMIMSVGVYCQTSSPVVLQASTCEDLRQIFISFQIDKRIIITKNMRCDRSNWPTPVFATHQTVVEGSRFAEGVPAIDWADSTNAIILNDGASVTFQSLVLIQDFVHLGGLKLPFVMGARGASLRLIGSGVGIRSCQQGLASLIHVYDRVSRPAGFSGGQTLVARSNDLIYAENVVFIPPGRDNSTWAICKSMVQCEVNSPFQEDFQNNLHQEPVSPTCGTVSLFSDDANGSGNTVSSGSTSNGAFAVLVALFTALSTTLVLLLLFILFKLVVQPLMHKSKDKPSTEADEESPLPVNSSQPAKTPTRHSRHASSVSLLSSSVQLTDIELGVPLGKGIMGTVYKGYHNDKPLAVKVVDMEATESVVHDEDPVALYMVHHRHHPNVIDTILYQTHRMEDLYAVAPNPARSFTTGASCTETPLSSIQEMLPLETFQYRTFHVMEFCNLGTLEKVIQEGMFQTTDGQPKMLLILRTALDIAKGMQFLHSIKTVHGQLRPANVLLKGDATDTRGYICKVSDFGMTYLHERQHALELSHGRNLSFRAPETFRRNSVEYGSDVFAFGMVLWSMISNRVPFGEDDPAEIVSHILEGTRPIIPQTASRKYERLIRDCWHPDTAARPPFTNIIERLSKIITEFVRRHEKSEHTPHHLRSEKSHCSSSDLDVVGQGSGSALADNMLDTVEIHDGVQSGSVSPSSSVPFWEHFQSAASSPVSTKSDIVFPSFDVSNQSRPPRRACTSWDATNTEESPTDASDSSQQENPDNVVSKPSVTVSLRYGMGPDELTDSDDLSSDPSLTTK